MHSVAPAGQVTMEELELAARNHALPSEALRYPVTPVGLHYLLIHFDIPDIEPTSWRLSIDGRARSPLSLSLEELQRRSAVTMPVTMECAGNGRARLQPRPISQPWLTGAVGTAEWTGTPLGQLLEEAGLHDDAVEIVFTGHDRGIQGGVDQAYQRSLPVAEARRDEVLVAYAMNGAPLLPQHGAPARLIVPGWYGMTHVKWLERITAVPEPFDGYQQAIAYLFQADENDPGTPVTRIQPRSLTVPPGVPDFMSRTRHMDPGNCVLQGRAWSGVAPVTRVEVSADGGATWADAVLGESQGRYAWTAWTFPWRPEPGRHVLSSRATDAAGNVQPVDQPWNLQGMANTMVERIPVVVRPA